MRARPGEPVLPPFKSVLARVMLMAGLFYLAEVFIINDPPAAALVYTLIFIAIFLPLSVLLDRSVHRRRLRKWQAAQAAKK